MPHYPNLHTLLRTTVLIFTLGLACDSEALAQQVIFKRDVVEQMRRVYGDSTGPNAKFFNHAFIGMSMIVPINESDSAAITENGKSNQLCFGYRNKFKINKNLAINLELLYLHQKYQIKQDERLNIFSPGVINDAQKFNTNSIGLGLSFRINYGKRGNILGRYFDFGGDINYVFANRLLTRNKVDPALNNGAEKVKSALHNLDYVNPLLYNLCFRVGYDHLALFARYRFSDQFIRSDYFYPGGKLPELPRISIGLEIALYE